MWNRYAPSCEVWSTAAHSARRMGLGMLVLALACAPFAAAAAVAVAGPAPDVGVTDPADTSGVLDLLSARMTQVQSDLRFTFTTRRPFQISWLSAQARRTVCLQVGPRGLPGRAERLCVTGRLDAQAVYRSPVGSGGPPAGFVRATVTRPNLHTASVEFAASAAGLGRGRYDWSASSVWVRGSGCTAAAPCRDEVPDTGDVPSRVDLFRVDGCVASGASERFFGPPGVRDVALTFDDGPATDTLPMVDALHRLGGVGTFFEIGRQVPDDAALSRAVLRAGDELGDHTWSHPVLTAANAAAQIRPTQHAIAAATGFTPCLLRPPYGIAPPAVVGIARSLGLLTIQWDVDPRDWALPGAGVIASRVLSAVHPGAIVELHDGGGDRSETVQALSTIIPALHARGYRLVTIGQMLDLHESYSYTP
jgi:peptidoglycan-N-acetylglucosamine deacetylase